MKLPLSFSFKKKELPKYYLALLLREEKATAVIFEEIQGKAKVVGQHEEHFKDSVDTDSMDDFLEVLDKTISIAEETLPPNVETQNTIFGLKETWVEGAKIKKEYLTRLKKACEALGLIPVGFLVVHEAIASLLQEEEGAPVSAVLVEIGNHYEVVSLLRAGRIIETHRARIEDSKVKTTDRLLHHFSNPQILPTRIIILDGKKTDDLQQEYISHSWSKSLPFLHVPQITILSDGFDAKSILYGAATQMGFEVLGKDEKLHVVGKEEKEKIEEEEKEEEIEEQVPESEPDFGFVIGRDIGQRKIEKKSDNLAPVDVGQPKKKVEESKKNIGIFEKAAILVSLVSFIVEIVKKLVKNSRRIKRPPLPSYLAKFTKGPKTLIAVPIIIGLLIIVFLFYIFGENADVTLYAQTNDISKDADITLSTNSSTDPSNNILNISYVNDSEDGSVNVTATGKKEVGDKAKGSVTIYNNTDSTQSFSKGTTITSDKGLKFDLDQSVSVASASGDAFSGTKPGTSTVNVVADDIGTEYNLPSGAKFSVDGASSSIAAKNDNAFSGGTKKQVTVVSKDDVSKGNDDLIKSLQDKAKDTISKKAGSGTELLSSFFDTNISNKDVSKNVGDPASNFTIKGTVDFKSALYKTNEAKGLVRTLLSLDNSPVVADSLSYSFDNIKQDGDNLAATIHAKAGLLPKIDEKDLSSKIAGKSENSARSILSSISQIRDISIKWSPSIPFLPKILPRISSHIHIKVKG